MNSYIARFVILLSVGFAFSWSVSAQTASQQPVSEKARQYYEQSYAFITARKFDQAASALERAIEKEPEYAEAYFRLANVYELKSQVEHTADYRQKYREYYEKSVQLKPEHQPFMGAYLVLGQAYMAEGNYIYE